MSSELLHEDVFTLAVSPHPAVEPGADVRVSFVCANVGGGIADAVGVRFFLSPGLTYRKGSAAVDGAPIAQESDLFGAGASIGALAPDVERLITLEYVVATVIENGTTLPVQAALVVGGETLGSNVVTLVAQSRPQLQNERTIAVLQSADGAADIYRVAVQLHNAGASSAHDLAVTLPVPESTTYVPSSARFGAKALEPERDMPFTTPTLAPGETVEFSYRVRVTGALSGDTIALRRVRVASRETAEFIVPAVTAKVTPPAPFGGDALLLEIGESPVSPGVSVPVTVAVTNDTPLRVDDVILRIALPDGLRVASGSLRVGGRPLAERASAQDRSSEQTAVFRLHRISPGESLEVECTAYVVSPVADGAKLTIRAEAESSRGSRAVERSLEVRSVPVFDPARIICELTGPSIVIAEEATGLLLQIENDGTSPATNATLRFAQSPLRIRRMDGTIADDPCVIDLGTLQPNDVQTLRLEAIVPSPISDGTRLPILITVCADDLEPLELPALTIVAESRPAFAGEATWLTHIDATPLRLRETTRARVTLANSGSDVARDVCVTLSLPNEAELVGVEGANTRDGVLHFGEIEAGHIATAELRIRLLEPIDRERGLQVGASLSASNLRTRTLEPTPIPIRAEPSFETAAITTEPKHTAHAGEPITFVLHMDNVGDGRAQRVSVRIDALEGLTYARGSTAVNGVSVVDGGSGSALMSTRGLILEDVGAGSEVAIEWRAFTDPSLGAGATVSVNARLRWEDGEVAVSSPPVHVDSRPVFATRTSGLGFRIGTAAVRPAAVPQTGGAATTIDQPQHIMQESAASPQAPPVTETAPTVVESAIITDSPLAAQSAPEPIADVRPVAEPAKADAASTAAPAPVQASQQEHVATNGVAHESKTSQPAPTNGNGAILEQPPVPASIVVPEIPLADDSKAAVEPHEFIDAPAHAASVEPTVPVAVTPAPVVQVDVARFAIVLDGARIEKLERFLTQAKFSGFITHIFSLRAFFPDITAAGEGDELATLLVTERDALRSVLDRLFIKVRIPNYDMTASDIEDRSARTALVLLMEAIAKQRAAAGSFSSPVYSEAAVSIDVIREALRFVREAPLGDIAPFRTLVNFMPTSVQGWPALGNALLQYRSLLFDAFESIGAGGPDAFASSLFDYATPELDRIREEIVALLAVPVSASR